MLSVQRKRSLPRLQLCQVPRQGLVRKQKVLHRKNCSHCYDCGENCRKGLLSKIKQYGFTLFIKKYGEEELLNCLERNERNGVVYHRSGINGDYDEFDDVEELICFIKTGKR